MLECDSLPIKHTILFNYTVHTRMCMCAHAGVHVHINPLSAEILSKISLYTHARTHTEKHTHTQSLGASIQTVDIM